MEFDLFRSINESDILMEDIKMCEPIFLIKGNEVKKFYMFEDGSVRDMSHGIGKVIDYYAFIDLYNSLLKTGYVEI